jgi:hypothetical protein
MTQGDTGNSKLLGVTKVCFLVADAIYPFIPYAAPVGRRNNIRGLLPNVRQGLYAMRTGIIFLVEKGGVN